MVTCKVFDDHNFGYIALWFPHAVGRSVTSFTSQPLYSPLLSSFSSDVSYQLVTLLPSSSRLLVAGILLLCSPIFPWFHYCLPPSLRHRRSILTYPVPCKHSCPVHCQCLACVTHLDIWHKNHSSEPLNRLRSLSAGSMTDLFVTSPVPVTHSCLLIRMFLMKSGQINVFIDKKKTHENR